MFSRPKTSAKSRPAETGVRAQNQPAAHSSVLSGVMPGNVARSVPPGRRSGADSEPPRQVVHQVERLRQHDAVKGARREVCRVGEIRNQCRLRMARRDVQHVRPSDPTCPTRRVYAASPSFEDAAVNQMRILLQELLDVITVDRETAVISETTAQGGQSSE